MIAAILRAQFLSTRMSAFGRGAVLSTITAVIWYGIWTVIAAAVFLMASAAPDAELAYLPYALLAVFLYWQGMPILSASTGSALDMRKLRHYPLRHGKLFVVEVLLRLTTGIEMMLVLTGGVAGLLRNRAAGGWPSLPRLLLPVLMFVLFNLLLASGLRSLLERLLSRRKVREVLVFLLLMLWVIPRLLVETGVRFPSLHGVTAIVRTVGWPWSATARAMLGQSLSISLLSLGCWTLVAAWFGRFQFERGLHFDVVAAQATPLRNNASRTRSLLDRFYRLPSLLWRDPLAAIVEKELRSLARAPRFRMVFVMGFTFGMVVWLPLVISRRAGRRSTSVSQHFLTIVCLYALTLLGQVSYWNCFGFDRSAAQIYFAAPQPLSRTLMGKNIAALLFIYLEVVIVAGITAAFGLLTSPAQVVEAVVVIGVSALYMMAMGNISSVQYPRALNPERVSQGGGSGRLQALLFLLYPLSLLPVFLAYLARYAFDSEFAFWIVLALAAAIGGVLYWIAMDSAVRTAVARREKIIQDLSRGEGPVSSE